MTYGSLFTGIGGFDLGFDRAGMRGLWQVENDKDCNRVLGKHWNGTKRFGDITTIDIGELRKPDVIFGGFPCQDLSVAGQRAGLAGARSGLWSEFHRIIAGVKPSFVVIENVPGLYSSWSATTDPPSGIPTSADIGRRLVLEERSDFDTIIGGLEELRYCLAWCVLDSQYRGVAQRRERVFIVGSLGNGSCAEILFESESVRGDSAPSREKREGIAGTISARAEGGGGLGTDFEIDGGLVGALDSRHNVDRGDWNHFSKLIPEVAGCLQERDTKASDSDTKEGHLIPYTLQFNDTNGTRKDRPNGGLYVTKPNASPALTGAESPVRVVSHALRSEGADASEDGTGKGTPLVVMPALRAGCPNKTAGHGARSGDSKDDYIVPVASPITAGYAKGSGVNDGKKGSPQNLLMLGASVRRLTPRECERLQGFPDDWTRFDSQGKEISDSARYRMLGNAVTVTVAEWIAKRIVSVSSARCRDDT